MDISGINIGAIVFGFILGWLLKPTSSVAQMVDWRRRQIPSPEVADRIEALLNQEKKVEAIKCLRDSADIGLKEAKDIIDTLSRCASFDIRSLILENRKQLEAQEATTLRIEKQSCPTCGR